MFETIKTDINNQTGWITLDREERRNALNPRMVEELNEALNTLDNDQKVISLVLTGSGSRAFCAGMDIGDAENLELSFLDRHEMQRRFIDLLKTIKALRKPLVARVQGQALGGGFGLMCACDLVVAADDISCGTPEINLGLFPYIITAVLLRSGNNPGSLLEMMLCGDKISAMRAVELGFINHAVKREELDDRVSDICAKLNKKSPAILRLGRRAFYNARDMSYENALEYLSGMLSLNMQAGDMLEGITAFMEKREPQWKGR
jgi:enoyl-CoA hydratase/carnithine racemase